MSYTKPEVEVLGKAASVIEQTSGSAKSNLAGDPPLQNNAPAYDLDE